MPHRVWTCRLPSAIPPSARRGSCRGLVTANFAAALVAAALLHAPGCRAAADPTDALQLALTARLMHDDNLFRQPDSRRFVAGAISRGDTVARVGIALKFDRPISRQHVLGEIDVAQNTYRDNSYLDHVSGRARARWDWQVGNYWSGELGYEHNRRISNFADVRVPIKNIIEDDLILASAGYQFHPRWRVGASLSWLDSANSSPLLFQNDAEITTASIGVDYTTPSRNSAGVELRRSEGSYPNREAIVSRLINNQYDETTGSAVWKWTISGASRFNGKAGYTQRRHEQFAVRDYEGPTFFAQYLWAPTGKLTASAVAFRQLATTEVETASYVVVSGIRVVPVWSVTSKISLRASAAYEERSYQGDPGIVVGIPVREDKLKYFGLYANYAPVRNAELALAFEAGSRESNRIDTDYAYRTAGVTVRLKF